MAVERERDAITRQRNYYAATAGNYDAMHLGADVEHDRALRYMRGLIDMLDIKSFLDVGSGTGRAIDFLLAERPHLRVCGVEPVGTLIQQAARAGRASARVMLRGSGERLPFADGTFQGVCEFGVLHHVQNPALVLREMLRVATRLVCLSDENRFGMVGFPRNLVQLLVFKSGQWRRFYRVWTCGKGFQYSEADGVRYSYSVYDSFRDLADWADHLLVFPTDAIKPKSWFHPLFTSGHVLLCAYRD